jgi:hypothetical protein
MAGHHPVSQLALFAQAGENVIADDARGRIVYTPGFVRAEVARVWFDDIRGAVAWEAQRQLHYTHGVPKTSEPVGPRISLAFRVRP